ncbi:hypothetical protein ACW7EJ_11825, partial [Acinetobacter soli]
TTLLSSEFAKRFKKKVGGRIVNLTSGQFQGPMPGELAYATTKGLIDRMGTSAPSIYLILLLSILYRLVPDSQHLQ